MLGVMFTPKTSEKIPNFCKVFEQGGRKIKINYPTSKSAHANAVH